MFYKLHVNDQSIRIKLGENIIAYVPSGNNTNDALNLVRFANAGSALDEYIDKYVQEQIIVYE